MLVGQQLGPFIVDKELGSGAMGTVYRGRYLKTGQVVAIKVMAPGLGATNRTAADRFAREAAILKQLKHPHIVGLFAIGKSQGMRYIAMEYIDGESLDKVMSRRNRMSWEEVVEIGQQLCGALQHAHDKGIIHRDLKPSNLMVLRDGNLKLTDFGIAKDLDVTQLTSANCTIGTAAYMSPEQCKGERVLTNKSDLYSLGVVFYELITGRKPFNAENAMDMFMQHVQGEFPRPAHLVMELPVWLDNLICGMLAKKPADRPIDAQMVGSILGSIRTKVEEQKSAGVEVANAKRKDRAADNIKLTQDDKAAARFLLKGKVRRQKKPSVRKPVWKKAVALSLALVVAVAMLVLAFRPKPAGDLYDEAIKMIKESPDKAREGPVEEYLRRFGRSLASDPHTQELAEWAEKYDIDESEKLLRRHVKSRFVNTNSPDEEKAFKAIDVEWKGALKDATDLWAALERDGAVPRWQKVAGRHLAILQQVKALVDEFEEKHGLIAKNYRDDYRFKEDDKQGAFLAWRADMLHEPVEARDRWKALKPSDEVQERSIVHVLAVSELLDRPNPDAKDLNTVQKTTVEETLNKAKATAETEPASAYLICADIVSLYADDLHKHLSDLVAEALELKRTIEMQQKKVPQRGVLIFWR
jgi:serine/threonine-protein kinase